MDGIGGIRGVTAWSLVAVTLVGERGAPDVRCPRNDLPQVAHDRVLSDLRFLVAAGSWVGE